MTTNISQTDEALTARGAFFITSFQQFDLNKITTFLGIEPNYLWTTPRKDIEVYGLPYVTWGYKLPEKTIGQQMM